MTQDNENGKSRKKGVRRDERLAAALRENLRRRKAQERARGEHDPAAKSAPAPHGGKDR